MKKKTEGSDATELAGGGGSGGNEETLPDPEEEKRLKTSDKERRGRERRLETDRRKNRNRDNMVTSTRMECDKITENRKDRESTASSVLCRTISRSKRKNRSVFSALKEYSSEDTSPEIRSPRSSALLTSEAPEECSLLSFLTLYFNMVSSTRTDLSNTYECTYSLWAIRRYMRRREREIKTKG